MIILGKLAIYVLFLGHWVGCIWWGVGESDGFGPREEVKSGRFRLQLAHTLYWGMSALTGLGSSLYSITERECLLCIFICLMGSFVLAYILGEVFNVIQVINAPSVRYSNVMNELEEFIIVNHVSTELSNRMRRWQAAQLERSHGIDEETVLGRLPPITRQDLANELVGSFMQNSELFRLMPKSFQETSLTFLKPSMFAKGDTICKQGDIGNEMFFIEAGEVTVSVDGNEVAILGPGDCVGETALLERSLRTASAIA